MYRGRPCPTCQNPVDHDWRTTSNCTACHRAKRRAAQARYRETHADAVRVANRQYLKDHPEANRAAVARHRAKRRGGGSA